MDLCTALLRFMGKLDPWFFRMLYLKVQLKFRVRLDEVACARPWDLYNLIANAAGPSSADLFLNAFKNWIWETCGCFMSLEEVKMLLTDSNMSNKFACVEGGTCFKRSAPPE